MTKKRKSSDNAPAQLVDQSTAAAPAAPVAPADEVEELTAEELADADAGWDAHRDKAAGETDTGRRPVEEEPDKTPPVEEPETVAGGVGSDTVAAEGEELDLEAEFEETPDNLKKLHHTIQTWKGRGK